jgi:hypothetical protein
VQLAVWALGKQLSRLGNRLGSTAHRHVHSDVGERSGLEGLQYRWDNRTDVAVPGSHQHSAKLRSHQPALSLCNGSALEKLCPKQRVAGAKQRGDTWVGQSVHVGTGLLEEQVAVQRAPEVVDRKDPQNTAKLIPYSTHPLRS